MWAPPVPRWTNAAMVVGTVVGAISLGTLSGWLTGQSDPHETVVAATIPAILSLGGGAFALVYARNRNVLGAIHAVAFIVTFCVCFKGAVSYSTETRRADAVLDAEHLLDAHLRHLEACSKAERLINGARIALQLDALPTEYFCRRAP